MIRPSVVIEQPFACQTGHPLGETDRRLSPDGFGGNVG
jgi:hypothetical protein